MYLRDRTPVLRWSASWLMVLATLLFAAMGVCVKLASMHFATPVVVVTRGLVGVLVMAALAQVQRSDLRTPVPWLHLRRGLAGTMALGLWFYSMSRLPLATAVTLNYTSSVWMAVFLVGGGLIAGDRDVDRRLVSAILLGFVGVACVLHPTIERDQWLAGVMGLVSGMLAAIAYLQVKALGQAGEPEIRVVFYFSLTGTASGLLACLLWSWVQPACSDTAWSARNLWMQLGQPATHAWVQLLGVGMFATLAQLAMTRAYARGRALVNANLQYLGVVHAFVLGVCLFGESMTPTAVAGVALIVAAGVAATRWQTVPVDQASA